MRGHVSAESQARYAEGLLSRARAARVHAHLAGCPQCAADQARLAEVTAALRDIPAPSLPPALAARLDAALAAESARRAALPAGAEGNGAAQPAGPAPLPGPAQPAGAARRPGAARPGGGRWRWLQSPAAVRGLAAAAAVVVLGGVGYGIAQAVSPTSSASSGAAEPAAGLPAAGGHSAPGMQPNSSAAGSSAAMTVTYSGTRYQPGTLGQQAAAQLARSATASRRPAVSAGPLARQPHPAAALRACALAIARGRPVRLVDEGSYQGRRALIIVVEGHPPMVYVTGPGCTPAHPAVRARAQLAAAG